MRSGENRQALRVTEGSLIRNIWQLALPTLVAYGFMDLFSVVDMIFVGRLGPPAIAAVSICGILMGVIRMLAIGIRTGTVAMISRFVGSNRWEEAESILGQSLLLSLGFSALVAAAGYAFAEPVIAALGAAEEVLPLGVAYFRIMSLGGVTMFMLMALGGALRGFGDAVTPMRAMAAASVLNIAMDPLLIFGLGPFPELGVAGSALATVLARAVGSIYLVFVLVTGRRDAHLSRAARRVRWDYIARIVRIGMFSTIRSLGMNVSRLVLVRIVALFGTAAIAAFGIGMRLRIFILMLGFGLGDAASVMVGQNLGSRQPGRAERSSWLAVAFYAAFLVVVGALFLAAPRAVVSVFNNDPAVLSMGGSFLSFLAFALLFMDLAVILGRALAGAGETFAPMVITIVSLIVIGIPLVWALSRLWGVEGIWLGIAVTEALQGIGTLFWFRSGRWKHKRV